MALKRGLNKGLDSLIPDSKKSVTKTTEKGSNTNNKAEKVEKESGKNTTGSTKNDEKIKEVVKEVEVIKEVIKEVPKEVTLKITEMEPNRDQPRKNFDEDSLVELAESIKQVGLIQPIVVRKREDYYEIIAGERRWRAAKLAKIKEVPVVIKEYTDQQTMEIALIENIQRENLNPIEEAVAYKRLIEEFSLLQDELAEKVSKSRASITNSMRLLKLDERVQNMLIEEMISSGHARALLAITDNDEQYKVAQKIFDEKLSVRDTEKLVKSLAKPEKVKVLPNPQLEMFYKEMGGKLATAIGTKVLVNNKNNGKGKIEIEYYSQEEFERISDYILGMNK